MLGFIIPGPVHTLTQLLRIFITHGQSILGYHTCILHGVCLFEGFFFLCVIGNF